MSNTIIHCPSCSIGAVFKRKGQAEHVWICDRCGSVWFMLEIKDQTTIPKGADVGALVEKAQKACIEYFSGGDSGPFKSRMKELRAELDKWK